jgi:hypothetical protein
MKLVTYLSTICLGLTLSCAPRDRAQEPPPSDTALEWQGFRATVVVPDGEPASVGTYWASVAYPDGRASEITGERDGSISQTWLTDLGGDGVPELVVWMTSAGSGSYGQVEILRLEASGPSGVPLAPLDESQARGYMGHDRIAIREGRLTRCFPLYRADDPQARPTGGERCLWYSFRKRRWVESD